MQYDHHTSTAQTLVENVARNAPVGTEVATAILQSVFSTANNACDTARKATEHAIELAKGNFAATATAAAAGKTGQQGAAQRSRVAKP